MAGAVIIGAGPGIGTSVARRFAAAGMPVGLISRTAATVDAARAAVAAGASRWPARPPMPGRTTSSRPRLTR